MIERKIMLNRAVNYLRDLRDRQRINIALSKGAATRQSRNIDLTIPSTWEFSAFSQNGEDGILDVLRGQLLENNRYFIEIGAADGIENNSSWLTVAERYSGMMIEGSSRLVERAKRNVAGYSIGVECHNMFVTQENIAKLREMSFHADPDIFSLDIDGNDYYIAQAILENGFRPKIFVVEYNSVFGPSRSQTIAYQENFVFTKAHPTHLYYGVSIAGWRNFFDRFGYRFVTVDQNGVNAFFVAPKFFNESFLDGVEALTFAENRAQYLKFRIPSQEQFLLISDEEFISIDGQFKG